jgi:LAGLIDADG endonuclease
MLESLSIPHYDSVRSGQYRDNVSGAGNQQERLIQLGWVIGFVDGEGCFSIGFVRQSDRTGRKGYKTGYQVAHEFAVTQGAKSVSCLYELVDFFNAGSVIANRRHDNHKEHLYRYVVRRRRDLIDTIIPFFKAHPMHSSKQQDFEKFACCVGMIDAGAHRTHAGLADIAEITQTMNRQKSRRDLIRILRDHTPEIQDTGS